MIMETKYFKKIYKDRVACGKWSENDAINYKPKENIILKYDTKNISYKILDITSHIILYIEILITLFSIGIIIKILIKDYKDEIINNNTSVQ